MSARQSSAPRLGGLAVPLAPPTALRSPVPAPPLTIPSPSPQPILAGSALGDGWSPTARAPSAAASAASSTIATTAALPTASSSSVSAAYGPIWPELRPRRVVVDRARRAAQRIDPIKAPAATPMATKSFTPHRFPLSSQSLSSAQSPTSTDGVLMLTGAAAAPRMGRAAAYRAAHPIVRAKHSGVVLWTSPLALKHEQIKKVSQMPSVVVLDLWLTLNLCDDDICAVVWCGLICCPTTHSILQ